jgi:ribonuclease P protein component
MCENTRRKNYRLAVVVSKKVHKSAVVRNRIRRRLFAIVHQYSDQIKPSMDIVVTVFNDSIATIPAAELEENVVKLLERAELIKQPADKPRHDIIETEET